MVTLQLKQFQLLSGETATGFRWTLWPFIQNPGKRHSHRYLTWTDGLDFLLQMITHQISGTGIREWDQISTNAHLQPLRRNSDAITYSVMQQGLFPP